MKSGIPTTDIQDAPAISRRTKLILVGRMILFLCQKTIFEVFYNFGYIAHFYMAHDFVKASVIHLLQINSENWRLLYWCTALPSLFATFLSLRTFEHVSSLGSIRIGNRPPSALAVRFLSAISLTLFLAGLRTSSLVVPDWDKGKSGRSAILHLAAAGFSMILGLYTGAYKRDKWQFRESIGNLVKGRMHDPSFRFSSVDVEALDKDEIRANSRPSETCLQVDFCRCVTLLVFWEDLYSIYVDIARLFRIHIPGPLSKFSLIIPQLPIWSPQVVFWIIAILILCTLVRVVVSKGPIFCFGKPVDINLLRLATVIPPVLALLTPGGWGDDWKALVIWTFSLAPCVLIGLATRAIRIVSSPSFLIPCGYILISYFLD